MQKKVASLGLATFLPIDGLADSAGAKPQGTELPRVHALH